MQKHSAITLLLIIVASFCFTSVGARENRSIGQSATVVTKLVQYYDSGGYLKDVEKKAEEAKKYLARRVASNKIRKFAITIDIDETALSNFKSMQRLHFSRNMEAVTGAYMLGDAPAIEPILELYKFAIKNNVTVFFVSSRPNTPEIMMITTKNLRRAGYSDWGGLHLRSIKNDELSIRQYKTQVRKKITDLGYDIILNIGDQQADLEGGFAEVAVKMPNPFYFKS